MTVLINYKKYLLKVVRIFFQAEWPEGHKLAAAMNFRWPQMVRTPLKQIIPHASQDGLNILSDMLAWDPQKRPTCQQVRENDVFRNFAFNWTDC